MRPLTQISLVIFLFSTCSLSAQESGHSGTQEHGNHDQGAHSVFMPHRLAIFTGYGSTGGAVDENGSPINKVIPIFALDYEYWFSHKIGIGWQNDLELASYTVERDHQEYLMREYAIASALVCVYEPIRGWALFAGPGYEFEKHENFPMFKIGTDIAKNFEGGWDIGITIAYDIKEVNSMLSVGLTAGKRFGGK